METTLVIMAAGIGSRFGGGIKQLEAVGRHGEIIMDYSIHDAIEAGFCKIIFIIRRDIQEEFQQVIGSRIEKICGQLGVTVEYAFQSLEDLPKGISLPAKRTKPWGTGQAVLCCKELIHGPCAVINADDYYGKEAFRKLHDFLVNPAHKDSMELCMAGFILKNTLSDHGGVTRGVCETGSDGNLAAVHETKDVRKIVENGKIFAEAQGKRIDPESLVSMNMWGLTPEFVALLEKGFEDFFAALDPAGEQILKAEYLLPIFIDKLLHQGKIKVKVLQSDDQWFGVTYKEDKAIVAQAFQNLIDKGVYQDRLFDDLLSK